MTRTSPTFPSSQNVNPFDQLISETQGDPNKIQGHYETHRSNRNARFKNELLHPNFTGWKVDEILRKLQSQTATTSPIIGNGDDETQSKSQFTDHRHNLTFYARPPQHVKELVAEIQQEIKDVAPSLWFTPIDSLHITTIEITSSRTKPEIDALVSHMLKSGVASKLVDYTLSHRARLVRPIVSYDASAMAVSFVPAAGEPVYHRSEEGAAGGGDDEYTYHHLRRDLAAHVMESGIHLTARYTVPSAHVTIARFVTQDEFLLKDGGVDGERVAALVEKIESVNKMLQCKYWPRNDGTVHRRGEWVVGHEEGLEFCKGTSWYGGGEKVLVGKGWI